MKTIDHWLNFWYSPNGPNGYQRDPKDPRPGWEEFILAIQKDVILSVLEAIEKSQEEADYCALQDILDAIESITPTTKGPP